MSASQHFDLICLGGGSGGIACANRAAQYGKKVAVIEGGKLGGTCVNVGCVPKKIMWYAANALANIHQAGDFGIDATVNDFSWQDLIAKRTAYIARLNGLYEQGLNKNGVQYFQGFGKFVDNKTIKVGNTLLSADKIIIATGARSAIPNIEGADLGIDSDGFFALKEQPQKVVIVGAGYIAMELAGVLASLGSEVICVLRKERPLRHFDADIIHALMEDMQSHGVRFVTHSQVARVSASSALSPKAQSNLHQVTLDNGEVIDHVDALIWAIGRVANSADLGLENTQIKVEPSGEILSDEWEQTNIEGVYAIGDINGKAQLTPVAIAAGRRLADREFNGQTGRKVDYSLIPTVIFTHPPIASVGMSEAAARAAYNDNVQVFQSRFKPMSHAFSAAPPPTIVKLLVRADDQKVLGVHAIGFGVDEMLQGFAVALKMGATKADFDDTIAIHPTLSEELVTLR